MKDAAYFTIVSPGTAKVRCDLCPHRCLLTDGKTGICLARRNIGGILRSLVYCRPVSTAIDPIEKKPLYHFFPGSRIFSTGPNGCTLKCLFCQNSEISQAVVPTREISAAALAEAIINSGTIGAAYTYSEPFVWFETIMEVGAIVREHGLKNVMVTNGFMEPKPLADLLTLVDAMNIDIKSMDPAFYRTLCKARLAPVLAACETAKKKCHLEITNLLIPGKNDSARDIRLLVEYVATNLGKDTPVHFSRYFPRYRMQAPPTPHKSLLLAYEIAREKLDFVYMGNVDSDVGNDTCCPSCGTVLIRRDGYSIFVNRNITQNPASGTAACPSCNYQTNIVIA
jgi:pyruvate formate lyase activating enzyme